MLLLPVLLCLVPCALSLPVDNPASGSLSFTGMTQVVAQSGGMANFLVSRSGGSSGAVTVSYTTRGGSAVPGVDYTAVNGTLSWESDDVSNKTVSVRILNTTPSDEHKTFYLALSESSGAGLGAFPLAVVTIANSFVAPSALAPTLDWSTWKLQLPVDMYRRPDPASPAWGISSRDLVGGFADDFFYANTTSQEVVFTAPANGASTTPGAGSDHTRSELREVWSGGDAHGDWINTIGGAMRGRCRVLSVAPGSTQATFAQIHGQDFVFALLLYRAPKNSIELKVYNSNAEGAGSTTYTVRKPVTLGDTIDYDLVFYDNAVRATVNGNLTVVTVDDSWLLAPVYFKAGAYHAVDNAGNAPDDKTVVAYSSLSIDHST
ncbi:concanavalin A-like lectin/glucanase [Auricularia subglabra TFB-10046 SS5]|nr:concanavalin A-like lectin/glucanase [Auricularia subglabra TFB-10046 SS5]